MPRILLVDDDEELVENVTEILENAGHHVVARLDSDSGLDAWRQGRFDAALLDLRMRTKTGVELRDELAAVRPDAIFVMMTGYPDDVAITPEVRDRFASVLGKPVDVRALLALFPPPSRPGCDAA